MTVLEGLRHEPILVVSQVDKRPSVLEEHLLWDLDGRTLDQVRV